MTNYAAQMAEDGTVVRVIVGTAEWATANLGGDWQDSMVKLPLDDAAASAPTDNGQDS